MPARTWRRLCAWLSFVVVIVAAARPARANIAEPSAKGALTGILEPQKEHGIRVDGERLTFDVHARRDAASVEAVYTMTCGDAALAPEVAFAFVSADHAEALAASVHVDGQLVPVELVTKVADLQEGWSTLAGGRTLGFLLFKLSFAPHQTRTVAVDYTQLANFDRTAGVYTKNTFEYLLSPARSWASFGPLQIEVKLPPDTSFASPLRELRRQGDAYVATLPTLPDGELVFDVSSSKGLWFGVTDPDFYFWIFLGALVLTIGAVGRVTGRRWPAVSAVRRVLGVGVLGWGAAAAVMFCLLATFPAGGLGYGYDRPLLALLLVMLSGPVCVTVSFVSARAARARALAR